jgi:2-desacetyl-2-hydroxyethyl bacteriochlorophyllide A dehydrogenase
MTPPSPPARRLAFTAQETVVLEPFAPPAPADDEVLVQTLRSLLSTGTETIVYQRKFAPGTHWDNWVRYPFYPGYASVGIVRAVGSAVTTLKPGDRVASRTGHRSHDLVKADQCFPVPAGVSADDAAWFPLAKIAGHGVRAAGITLGDAVVVIGAGPIGQMAVRWALAAGAGKALILDLAPARLALAAAAGATTVLAEPGREIDAVTQALGGARPPVVIDSTGNAAVLKTAFALAADRGTVVLLGDTGAPGTQTLTSDVITRGLHLVGVHDNHNTPSWNNATAAAHFFQFLQDGRFRVDGLNTHHFRPEDCRAAYTLATTDRLHTMGILFDWAEASPGELSASS